MEAKIESYEVRIGNLLEDRIGRLCEVERLESNDDWDDGGVHALAIEGGNTSLPVRGIPLTQEWLKKFGFEGSDPTFIYKGFELFGKDAVSYNPTNDWPGLKIGIHSLEYVHQLQNLFFAITGEELEFNPKS